MNSNDETKQINNLNNCIMKQFTLKSLMLLLLLLIGGGSFAWGETKTGTIKFGTNNFHIGEVNVTGNDDLNNSWSVVTVGTTSFSKNPTYSQVGSSGDPAESITFTMTLPSGVKFTSFSAKFGGFKGTAGNISLTVDGTKVGSGNLSATKDVVVGGELKTATTGKELKVTVTNIARGVKCYNISYTYEDSDSPSLSVNTTSVDFGKVVVGASVEPKNVTVTMANIEGGATAKLDKGEASPFAVTPESLSATGDVAVSPKAETLAAAGVYEDKLTFKAGELTKTVDVKLTVAKKNSVTWNVNGNGYTEGNPTTEVVEGEKVEVLPTAPASIGGLVFMGWTNEAVTSQEAAPAVLFTSAADAPAVTADATYYAVFAAQAGTGWIRVTELSDITEGSYVIKNADFVLPNTNTGSTKLPQKVSAPSITGNVITGEVDESMVWQFVPTGFSNKFYIKNAAGDYLYATNANNGLHVDRTSTPSQWTFEENGTDYFAMKNAKSSRYCATYKAGKDWRSYTSKSHVNYANGGKLELYRNDISYSNYTTTVETNSLPLRAFDGKNHFATFSSDKAVKFVDATVYAVDVNDDRLILTEVESKQVPANTGVLLKSAGTEATYSVIGSAPAIENNLLCASVEEGQTTAADGTTDGYSFFKLSYNRAGENEKLGFYWAAENGAPFISKAGLAYLAVKTTDVAAVKGFSLIDMETGISKVSGSAAGNGVIYDLQGRRVEHAVRGLYIVNGRKVMVK